MKYLKLFATDNNRLSYEDSENYLEPYVSYVEGDDTVHYNKAITETKLVVYYDIQDISAPTTIFTNYDNSVKTIEVDGTLLDGIVTTYQFDTVGQHVIKYEFNNPTTVGNNAPLLYNLTTAKRVVIPNTFTAISDNAFLQCSALTSVTIGNCVTTIGGDAFANCSGLISITIPNSVTSIDHGAFRSCSGLTSVTIGSGITSIGSEVFRNCSSLTEIVIPNSVTSIRNHTFGECTSLTRIIIPNSVSSIGQYAFGNCSSLTEIVIPDSVTEIGAQAFYFCGSLTNVTVEATSPPTLGGDTFYSTNNCPIYVPSASVDTYKIASGWNNYASRIQAIPTT